MGCGFLTESQGVGRDSSCLWHLYEDWKTESMDISEGVFQQTDTEKKQLSLLSLSECKQDAACLPG